MSKKEKTKERKKPSKSDKITFAVTEEVAQEFDLFEEMLFESGILNDYNPENMLIADANNMVVSPLVTLIKTSNSKRNYNKDLMLRAIDYGCNVNFKDSSGFDLMRYAAIYGAHQMIELFRARDLISLDGIDNEGNTTLVALCRQDPVAHHSTIRKFLELGANQNIAGENGDTPLIILAQNGHYELVAKCLESGNVRAENAQGRTALLAAVSKPDISAVDRTKIIRAIVDKKANFHKADKEGNTAILLAAANCEVSILQLLISAGCDVNVENRRGDNALVMAARAGNIESFMFLSEKGLLMSYAKQQEVVDYLQSTRASGNALRICAILQADSQKSPENKIDKLLELFVRNPKPKKGANYSNKVGELVDIVCAYEQTLSANKIDEIIHRVATFGSAVDMDKIVRKFGGVQEHKVVFPKVLKDAINARNVSVICLLMTNPNLNSDEVIEGIKYAARESDAVTFKKILEFEGVLSRISDFCQSNVALARATTDSFYIEAKKNQSSAEVIKQEITNFKKLLETQVDPSASVDCEDDQTQKSSMIEAPDSVSNLEIETVSEEKEVEEAEDILTLMAKKTQNMQQGVNNFLADIPSSTEALSSEMIDLDLMQIGFEKDVPAQSEDVTGSRLYSAILESQKQKSQEQPKPIQAIEMTSANGMNPNAAVFEYKPKPSPEKSTENSTIGVSKLQKSAGGMSIAGDDDD